MTHAESFESLVDETLQILVAELFGFEQFEGRVGGMKYAWHKDRGDSPIQWAKTKRGEMWLQKVPDFIHDLNAMNRAENMLTRRQQRKYIKILSPKYIKNLSGEWCVMHASARKRAEAFAAVMTEK